MYLLTLVYPMSMPSCRRPENARCVRKSKKPQLRPSSAKYPLVAGPYFAVYFNACGFLLLGTELLGAYQPTCVFLIANFRFPSGEWSVDFRRRYPRWKPSHFCCRLPWA
jgi:hypothetical protein